MNEVSLREELSGLTYFIRTFGCQMNLHDSERVGGLLESYGCLEAAEPAEADIVVFMTCCVREAARSATLWSMFLNEEPAQSPLGSAYHSGGRMHCPA